jgi:diaminopimelate decarboxylase
MHQLELFTAQPNHPQAVGLRVNPGMGSGHNNRLTTGGMAASFGLWHEYVSQALQYTKERGVIIDRLHVHVGTGGDPSKWGEVIDAALAIARQMPDITSLDIGGGFKIAYTEGDIAADMPQVIEVFNEKLADFATVTGRQLRLEIEPGRWLVAHSGCLITEIVDIVDTGADGYTFLRTNTGMNDFLRPAMYGAQHCMRILNDTSDQADYVVVGHACETGDILTPAPHDPEGILARKLNKASIGDLLLIADTGAYCASMSTKGYNAYPDAQEVFI